MLPADQVEALARLVDEVERVAAISKGAVRCRGVEQARKRRRRGARCDCREEGAFGGLAMAHSAPVPQPAPQCCEIGPALKRAALASRRFAIAVLSDPAGAV